MQDIIDDGSRPLNTFTLNRYKLRKNTQLSCSEASLMPYQNSVPVRSLLVF